MPYDEQEAQLPYRRKWKKYMARLPQTVKPGGPDILFGMLERFGYEPAMIVWRKWTVYLRHDPLGVIFLPCNERLRQSNIFHVVYRAVADGKNVTPRDWALLAPEVLQDTLTDPKDGGQ